MRCLVVAMVVLMASTVAAAAAQNGGNPSPPFDGPAAPVAPATVARDAQGHTTVRAQRLTAPLRIDGRVDEPIYSTVDAISDFIQMDPAPGTPAIERTEAWIFFDDSNMYVTMRAWETQPERRIAKEMRRDSNNIRQGDCLAFGFDTFFDKQTAFYFEVNPLGAFVDSQTTDRQVNSDWNVPWKLAVARFAGGWSFEAAVPFDVLRYKPGRDQVWGVQLRRYSRWRNEISFLTKVPPSLGLGRGSIAASLFATLVGIEAPAPGVNLEVKPYATANMTTDRNASPSRLNDLGADAGLDVKFHAGHTFVSGRVRIDADRIKSFAAQFDPQPFQLDERAATESMFGGLAASGWHTAAITMRLLVDSDLWRMTCPRS